MSAAHLSVRDLRVAYANRHGELVPVDGVSFEVRRGEILGFVGESGAGKSMTGSAIIGLIDPPGRITDGEITLGDRRVDTDPESFRGNDIGMVFQDPLTSLNPLRTVGEQLVETIQTHLGLGAAKAREKAMSGLEEVGIDPGRINAYPHEFSGGMRQRVVIALALAAEPELIIADEPTTALDVSVQAQILDLLKGICKERGASVILITHDMGVIAETTDRVAVLYAGKLAEIGPTEEVLTRPRHPYTQGLIASTPSVVSGDMRTMLHQIPGAMPRLDALPAGCSFHPRCDSCMDRCREQAPPMFEGRVACWLHEGSNGA